MTDRTTPAEHPAPARAETRATEPGEFPGTGIRCGALAPEPTASHTDAAHRPPDSAGGGQRCAKPADAAAGLGLCEEHLLLAAEWTAGRVGVTDVLPSPCLACGSRLGVRYPSGWLCAACEWRHGEHPDPDARPVRVDVVYYIRSRGRIKIGTSANPRSRLAQLHYEELLAFERGDRRLEQQRHAEFAEQRAGREWFFEHPELLAHIDVLRGGAPDPWDQHRRWLSAAAALAGR
ncbi:GIY-YIG nuclease family protein [Herbiconiux liangxiaofengii]|uniref:GIY-YIG nuclease family protein n=1 Tax=Herbiconiux liangxiaofengii TaxID=3342795 RepID=UPI0035BA05BB